MTFQQLLYVVEIARCRSMNKAAQQLFLSQSNISSSVRDLEEELGVRLFQRSNRGVELTSDGREFVGYATALLEQKEKITQIYQGQKQHQTVHFTVSTQRYPFTEDAFCHLLQERDGERYSYCIKETGMDAVIQDVSENRSDLGVMFLSSANQKMVGRILGNNDLEFHEIQAVQPCVYLRPGHPLARRRSLRPEELASYPYMIFEQNQGVSLDFSEEVQLGLQNTQQRVSVFNRGTAIRIIATSDAVTTGSGLFSAESSDPVILSIPLEVEDRMRLGWIKPKNKRLGEEGKRFLELLREAVDQSLAYTDQLRRQLWEQLDREAEEAARRG